MKLKAISTIILGSVLASTAAMAQSAAPAAPEPDYTLSYNVGVVSDYRFRGMAQTAFNPAVQGGIDFAHKSGAYLGVWASNISWIKDALGATDGSLEVDLYGGYKGAISDALSYDVGLITYQYPGNTAGDVPGLVNANTTEIYGALSYNIVTAKYSQALSNFIANAHSVGSKYLEVAATIDLGNGLSLVPHVGHQWIPNVAGDIGDCTDYSLTLGKDFGKGMSASLAVIGTNADRGFYTLADGKYLGDRAYQVGLKYSF